MSQRVTLTHPKLKDRTITVSASAARTHKAAGWVEEKSSGDRSPSDSPAPAKS